MKFLNVDEVNFIPNWFHKATYAKVYSPIVYLVNGQHVWETTEIPDVLPPPTKKMSGRLKKKLLTMEINEEQHPNSQFGLLKKCGICHKLGRNKKSYNKVPTKHGPS